MSPQNQTPNGRLLPGRNELWSLFHDERETIPSIARKYAVSIEQVKGWVKSMDIPLILPAERPAVSAYRRPVHRRGARL
mgnify:CR=1 FL=1